MRLIGTAVLLGLTLASPTPAGAPRPTTPAANAAGPGQRSASLQKVWSGEHGWQVLSVAFSPDGTLLAT
ncbi:MAG TPA: hypothetical protein VFU47_17940, partial [Armatimonadota bacterium]|nr:hypothetical protein [Armatimonadota bacterium]